MTGFADSLTFNYEQTQQKIKGSLQEIDQGVLTHVSKKKVPYKIVHGWDAKASLRMRYNLESRAGLTLFKQIQQAEPDETKQAEILDLISTEDIALGLV